MSNKLTTIEIARKKLLDSIQISTSKTKVTLQKSLMRISCNLIESELNLPSTANSAVDGYGISSKTYLSYSSKNSSRVAPSPLSRYAYRVSP